MANCGPLPDDDVDEFGRVFVKSGPQAGVQMLCQEKQSRCVQVFLSVQA